MAQIKNNPDLALLVAVALVLGSYVFFLDRPLLTPISRIPLSHYQLLTDALVSGQTHLKLEPDPRLATLENPYAGAQGIPRLHDASYYENRYYLYFGTGPVLTLLGPWKIITGTFLTDAAAVFIFCTLGFLLLVQLWREFVSRYFAGLSTGWVAAGVLLLGWGSYVTFILVLPAVYETAIACGFACMSTAVYFTWRALVGTSLARCTLWLGLASAAWGLSATARPHFAASLPILGIAAIGVVWRFRKSPDARKSSVRLLFWTIFPAAAFGCALIEYNLMRFGAPLEFGVTYQFAGGDMSNVNVTGTNYFFANAQLYFLGGCFYNRYFPFVEMAGFSFGLIPWAPFSLLGILGLLCFSRSGQTRPGWYGVILIVVGIAAAHLAILLILAFANARYLIDVLPYLVLASVGVGAALDTHFSDRVNVQRFLRGVFLAAGIYTIAHAILLTFNHHPRLRGYDAIAGLMNYPAHFYEQSGATPFGPIEGKISFPAAPAGRREPLASGARGRDMLFVEYLEANQIRFGFYHRGTVSPYSNPVTIEPGKEYPLRVDLGCFYPPPQHPLFKDYPHSAVSAFRRRVHVTLDDQEVFNASSTFYPSNPSQNSLGRNPQPGETSPEFTGVLSGLRPLGISSGSTKEQNGIYGPIRLTLRFPPFTYIFSEPLVSTGGEKGGDLVFVTYLAPGKARFGHDSSAFGGAISSRTITFDPEQEHQIEILTGPLQRPFPAAANGPLIFRFDGKPVMVTERRFAPTDPDSLSFGFNETRSSAASANFTGSKLEALRLPPDSLTKPSIGTWGAIRLLVSLPVGRHLGREPLLVSGMSGAGNLVYVIYEDESHIRIGYDHWGYYALTSEPIAVDYQQQQLIEISYGGLYPPIGHEWWKQHQDFPVQTLKDTLYVKVNDEVAFQKKADFHPSEVSDISIGANLIGGSSCEAAFLGQVKRVEYTLAPQPLFDSAR